MKWNLLILFGVIGMISLAIAQLPSPITNSGNLLVDGATKSLIYNFDWGQTTLTLQKSYASYKVNKQTFFNYTSIPLLEGNVLRKDNKWEYNFIDNSANAEELIHYQLIINSTEEMLFLEEQGFNKEENFTYKYPVLINYHLNPKCENEFEVGGDCQDFRHIFDFAEDICSHKYSRCGYIWKGNSTIITFDSYKEIISKSVSVGACRTLDAEGETYIQSGNIVQGSNADCIIINEDNVEYDGNGYSITSSYSRSGITTSADYLSPEIHDTTINMGNSDGGYGIELAGSSGKKVSDAYIYDNILTLTHRGLIAIFMVDSTLKNNIILNNHEDGIFFHDCDDNRIVDTIITSISGTKNSDVYLQVSSTNNVFLNVIYDVESVNGTSDLWRRWYYRAFVNDSCNDVVNGASVRVQHNIAGALSTTLTTGAEGYTSIFNITEYGNSGGVIQYDQDYKINVTHNDYFIKQDLFYNVTLEKSNLKDVFTFTEPNLSSINVVDCSCWDIFDNPQYLSKNVFFVEIGNVNLNANWTLGENANQILRERTCNLTIKRGVEWMKKK